jgi:hypothetical protein
MSRIIKPKSAGDPVIHTVKVGSKSLKLTQYESQDAFTIFIGGHDLFCIEAMFYKPTSSFITMLDNPVNIGHLTHIYYNQNCTLENNFQRGIDTNNIMRILCSYIHNTFPYIEYLTFSDASYRTCDDGHDVELAEMTYLRTGKTWYEKNYDAFIDEAHKSLFETMETRLENAKRNLTWNEFKQFISGSYPYPETEMKDMFENAATWQAFFDPLSERMGISKFCIFVAPWLHRFFTAVSRTSFSSFRYILPIHRVPTIDYTLSAYHRGGRKLTRRRVNLRKKNYQE